MKPRSRPPCPECYVGHALFGGVDPQTWQVLDMGLSQLPMDQAIDLVNKVYDAQTAVIGAAWKTAFESGAIELDPRCPDTVEELLTQVRLKINE